MKQRIMSMFMMVLIICGTGGTLAAQQEPNAQLKNTAQQEPTKGGLMEDKIQELEKQIEELKRESKARKTLEMTPEEKVEREKEILDAVSEDYTLERVHSISFSYSMSYSYSPGERITTDPYTEVEHIYNHNFRHTLSSSYGLLDNVSTSISIPFLFQYNKLGTDEELYDQDIGDISVGLSGQPFKRVDDIPDMTIGLGVSMPTGKSPYDINPEQELSTGSGTYGYSASINLNKSVDPVVLFGSLSYSRQLPLSGLNYKVGNLVLEKVKPGDGLSMSMGIGFAMSYAISLSMSMGISHSFSSYYYYEDSDKRKSTESTSGSMGIGIGWKVTPKTTLSISTGWGLTGRGFGLSFRVPFTYQL